MHENLNNPCHSVVTEMYGWVQIPDSYYQHNGKSMGIIITRSGTYSYHAFDARCPRCFYEEGVLGSKIHMYSRLSAICPVCKAEAINLVNMGTSGMTRYNHEYRSPAHLNVYSVSVIKKGKITYLRIANNPNGANGQWKKLPENKFLLNVDIRE